jgi:hypothetical protein
LRKFLPKISIPLTWTLGFSGKMLWGKHLDPLLKWLPAGYEKLSVRLSAILDAVMEHCYAESELSVLGRASSG